MSGPLGLPDRYRLDGLIATGGMAAVYAAHDTILDRPVAVKVLAEHLTENVDAAARFEREARAAAALSGHPAVVTIFDVGEHEGRAFIVMERRMGPTVAQVIKEGPVKPARALGWLADIAEVLDTAHDRGVVHRDIKPGNLLLDEHDRVAVADFGIASLANEQTSVTQTGEVLGTGAYLAPEQAAGDGTTSSASDRYALAVVAFELLTGEQPFPGGFAAQIRAHAEDPPPAASGLPTGAQDVLKQGMAKVPGERWATATAFVRALGAGLEGEPDRTQAMTRTPTPAPAAAPAPAAVAAALSDPPDGDPPRRRKRPPFAAVAVAVVGAALLISGLVLAATGDDDPQTASTSGQSAKQKDAGKKKTRATPTAVATSTVPPEPTETAEPAATATEPPAQEDTGAGGTSSGEAIEGDPAELNAEGYSRLQGGDADDALPYLEGAVSGCEGSSDLDPCGFAYYNLGLAYNAVGDYQSAANVLTQRLRQWPDDRPGVIRQALREACRGLGGQDCNQV